MRRYRVDPNLSDESVTSVVLGEAGMPDAAKLLAIAQRFFDAAMQPAEWVPALESMVDVLHAEHAVLFANEPASGHPIIAKGACMDTAAFERFLSPEAARWMAPFTAAMPNGTAVTLPHFMPEREFERTELYNEVVRRANGFYSVGVRHDLPAMSMMASVCRPRHRGDFAADDARSLETLLPSLATSLQLHHRLRAADGCRAVLTAVLDRLDDGVILTDATARPLFVNARAARIAAEADGLDVAASPLGAATPIATQRLREAVAGVAAGAAVAGQRLRLARPSQRPPLQLTVLPVARLDALVPGVGLPSVAIFISEVDAPIIIDCDAVRDVFHLTSRECDVAARLARGLDLERIAAELRIGRGTVRSHLMQIYAKTQVHSQAALVALLARFVCR
jgi:DNA-binding CsgD family transcriptional regulator